MPLLDFDSLVVCNNTFDIYELTDTVKYFNSLGIRKFIFTYRVNPQCQSIYNIKNNIYDARQILKSIKVRGTHIYFSPSLLIQKNIVRNSFISKLKVRASNMIFVDPSEIFTEPWIQSDLNHLLYTKSLVPTFLSFESIINMHRSDFATSLFQVPYAAYCLDLNFIVSFKSEAWLHKAITYNSPVVPCISSGSHLDYFSILNNFKLMRNEIGDLAYLKFCKHINQSCLRVFGEF